MLDVSKDFIISSKGAWSEDKEKVALIIRHRTDPNIINLVYYSELEGLVTINTDNFSIDWNTSVVDSISWSGASIRVSDKSGTYLFDVEKEGK